MIAIPRQIITQFHELNNHPISRVNTGCGNECRELRIPAFASCAIHQAVIYPWFTHQSVHRCGAIHFE
jgi:hypothetical protein